MSTSRPVPRASTSHSGPPILSTAQIAEVERRRKKSIQEALQENKKRRRSSQVMRH